MADTLESNNACGRFRCINCNNTRNKPGDGGDDDSTARDRRCGYGSRIYI